MKKGKNKSSSKNNFIHERQNLINKMCNALSLKYNNYFQAANYDNKTLKEDIEKLLSTQYYSKDPRDVFKPIEQNILDIVKQKNPTLQVKVKKARKLPEIKYTKDKYQEADEFERGIEKEKQVEIKKNKNAVNAVQKKGVSAGKKGNNNIKTKNGNEKGKNNIKENKGEINKVTDKQGNNKDKEVIKDVNIDNMPLSESIYKIENEYGVKHTLVDNLKSRIKYDPTVKYLDEEQKQYKKEQEEKKQKKILQQSKYLNELKSQIEEKDKLKAQEKEIKMKELEEIQQKIKNEKEKEQQKKQTEQQKREKLKKNYEQLIQEKEDIKKQQKLQEIKEDKKISEMINQEINNEKQNIIAKKKKVIEESIKLKEINDKLIQEKKNIKKPKDDFVPQDIFASNNASSSNVIRDRINKRAQEQEAAGNYLKKIYSTREKQNNDIYLVEKEKQDQKKQLEYEMADKNRQNKIDDYRKSLEDTIAMRSLERKKQKEEEDKFRKNLEEEYALYLKEEEQKKIKKFEQYENYRKALEEQIKDNRNRELERLKNQ